jgi:hypothetical protein
MSSPAVTAVRGSRKSVRRDTRPLRGDVVGFAEVLECLSKGSLEEAAA